MTTTPHRPYSRTRHALTTFASVGRPAGRLLLLAAASAAVGTHARTLPLFLSLFPPSFFLSFFPPFASLCWLQNWLFFSPLLLPSSIGGALMAAAVKTRIRPQSDTFNALLYACISVAPCPTPTATHSLWHYTLIVVYKSSFTQRRSMLDVCRPTRTMRRAGMERTEGEGGVISRFNVRSSLNFFSISLLVLPYKL